MPVGIVERSRWHSSTRPLPATVNARLWRQGQKSDTVVIHHIITQETIDERMIKALHQKDISQSALIEAVKAELGVTK